MTRPRPIIETFCVKDDVMPELSRFYGIVITLNFNDHAPPHFHAAYGEARASVSIADATVLRGWLPPQAARMVRDWAKRHRAELLRDWELARAGDLPLAIEPLE